MPRPIRVPLPALVAPAAVSTALALRPIRRPFAAATSSGISAASGRLAQYRLGISPCIVWVFSRAGLKVEA